MTQSHSALPWHYSGEHVITDANGKWVLEPIPYEGNWWVKPQIDIPLVIRAVNASPANAQLLEAAEKIMKDLSVETLDELAAAIAAVRSVK